MRMSDKPSELPTSRRENVGADDNSTISARLAQICYILVCLHVLFFGYLIVAHRRIHHSLAVEDSWVENLTAVIFLLAGIALLIAGFTKRRVFQSCVYILGSVALALFAGEEVNYGQRIIGFETPAFMADWNYQQEFNFYNTPAYRAVFGTPGRNGQILFALCIAACAAFFCRKDRIFGIPSPPLMLTLSLLVVLSFTLVANGAVSSSNFLNVIQYLILSWNRGLLMLLLLFALFSRNVRFFIGIAAALSLAVVTSYLSYHNRNANLFELIEYLFSVIAFFYALVALLDQEAARRKIAAGLAALKPAAALPSKFITLPLTKQRRFIGIKWIRLTSWIAVCALIIAGSVGLAFMTYSDVRAHAARFKETYQFPLTAEPTASSNFNVYIDGRDLYYFKQPCDVADVAAKFFLSAFPENIDDLPVERRQPGFANLDFRVRPYRVIVDGACATKVTLPAYEITRISTGQYVLNDDGSTRKLWIAEFPVGGE